MKIAWEVACKLIVSESQKEDWLGCSKKWREKRWQQKLKSKHPDAASYREREQAARLGGEAYRHPRPSLADAEPYRSRKDPASGGKLSLSSCMRFKPA